MFLVPRMLFLIILPITVTLWFMLDVPGVNSSGRNTPDKLDYTRMARLFGGVEAVIGDLAGAPMHDVARAAAP